MWALKIERAKLRNALGDAVMKLEEQKKQTSDVVKKLEELKREVSGKQGDLMTTGKERCNDRCLGLGFFVAMACAAIFISLFLAANDVA
jgi:hypothetical protein